MGKVFLIIGSVVGGLIILVGILALLGTVADITLSPSDSRDQITGSIFIMAVGLTLFAPCLYFFLQSRRTQSLLNQGMGPGGGIPALATAYAPVDLSSTYLQWFGWCQREIGGSAIALHAATMAALIQAGIGNSGAAVNAAKEAAARTAAHPLAQGQSSSTPNSKIRVLSRIGAAILPLLERDERVAVSFNGVDRQAQIWQSLFGIIGMIIAMSQQGAYFVTVTDRRLIVLTGPQLGLTPKSLAFAIPQSMVSEAKFRGGLLGGGTFSISRIDGPRTRLRLSRFWKSEAVLAHTLLAQGAGLTPLPPAPSVASTGSF
jgi:hypothetical protein